MKRFQAVAALATAVALVGATGTTADAAARHATSKATVTGFELQTSYHNSYGGGDGPIVVSRGGTFTMGCDDILEIDALVTGKHVKKGAAYSVKSVYVGATRQSYVSSWAKSGTAKVVLPEVVKNPETTGALTVTLKAKHKVIASGTLHIVIAGCM